MSTITTSITPFTTSPSRSNPSTFSADMDARLSEENGRITEMNAVSTEMNTVSGEVNTNATTATTKAAESAASAAAALLSEGNASDSELVVVTLTDERKAVDFGTHADETAMEAYLTAEGLTKVTGATYFDIAINQTRVYSATSVWVSNGTVDAYTKTQSDLLLADKADIATTYTKTEIDAFTHGKILQVVQGSTSTAVSNSSNTLASTGLSASITPSSADSKILVSVKHNGCAKSNANATTSMDIVLIRNNVSILQPIGAYLETNTLMSLVSDASFDLLDSPASTAAQTYRTDFRSRNADASVSVQYANVNTSTITLMEVAL